MFFGIFCKKERSMLKIKINRQWVGQVSSFDSHSPFVNWLSRDDTKTIRKIILKKYFPGDSGDIVDIYKQVFVFWRVLKKQKI